jgi:pSer/pThr/pTyr-binding forkhead associated (FHA) protein
MTPTVTFTVLAGPSAGNRFSFHERHVCTLGRATDCDLPIPSDAAYRNVSRHHCAFNIDPPQVRVRDNGSLNGTWVNGERLPPSNGAEDEFPCMLKNGDKVQIGNLLLGVSLGEEAPTPRLRACGASDESPCMCRLAREGAGR